MRAPGSTPDISDRYSLHFLPLPSESQRRIYCTSSEVLPELPAVRFSAEYNFSIFLKHILQFHTLASFLLIFHCFNKFNIGISTYKIGMM